MENVYSSTVAPAIDAVASALDWIAAQVGAPQRAPSAFVGQRGRLAQPPAAPGTQHTYVRPFVTRSTHAGPLPSARLLLGVLTPAHFRPPRGGWKCEYCECQRRTEVGRWEYSEYQRGGRKWAGVSTPSNKRADGSGPV